MAIRGTQECIRPTISKKSLVVGYMYHFSRGDFRGKLVGWCSGHVCVTPLIPPVLPGSHVRYAFEPGSCKSTFFSLIFIYFIFLAHPQLVMIAHLQVYSECKAGEQCLTEPRRRETEPR
ncbi:hypothetical protein NEUTE1DRAFT_101667 [Neurospora tetrasperma FGSC 2508]|uniref:Uncharacterized protein n=1 Tax=Neurospora tetrasperma (strain FGSC 2508 / ATCC MYA-4615 / P0657) TaxID=510951 RepID=F8MPV9_NEUT8|nr:uncharacterized protein NEUTE1DRAFT_101667 [Neurospora tetrasperma FGSC 2508]EGO56389.1 hypothetical protein NEUTE1DRAFT_101667 [Neurospora tetrasperma FGSC 2508]